MDTRPAEHRTGPARVLHRSLLVAALCWIAGTALPARAQHAPPATSPSGQPLPAYLTLFDGAADRTAIESSDAMWAMYAMISSAETRTAGSGRQILQSIVGLDAAASAQLTAHMTSAIADHDRYSVTMVKQQCANLRARAASASVTPLADTLTSIEDASHQHHDTYLAMLPQVVSPASQTRLTAWVDEHVRPTLKILKIDYASFLASPGVDRALVAGRICSLPSLAAAAP